MGSFGIIPDRTSGQRALWIVPKSLAAFRPSAIRRHKASILLDVSPIGFETWPRVPPGMAAPKAQNLRFVRPAARLASCENTLPAHARWLLSKQRNASVLFGPTTNWVRFCESPDGAAGLLAFISG
jgi:hypothetical protein